MGEEELRDSILLVFANKQDMPDAKSVQEVAEELGLQELQHRVWYIQASSHFVKWHICCILCNAANSVSRTALPAHSTEIWLPATKQVSNLGCCFAGLQCEHRRWAHGWSRLACQQNGVQALALMFSSHDPLQKVAYGHVGRVFSSLLMLPVYHGNERWSVSWRGFMCEKHGMHVDICMLHA